MRCRRIYIKMEGSAPGRAGGWLGLWGAGGSGQGGRNLWGGPAGDCRLTLHPWVNVYSRAARAWAARGRRVRRARKADRPGNRRKGATVARLRWP